MVESSQPDHHNAQDGNTMAYTYGYHKWWAFMGYLRWLQPAGCTVAELASPFGRWA